MAFIQLVTFEIGGEEYGVDINAVNGIIKSKNYKIFKAPNSSKCLEGMINLRGKINPVFNLKKKFQPNYETDDINEDSKIIIINNNDSTVGFLVDEVTDIFRINDEDIDIMSDSVIYDNLGYIKGIGKIEDKMIFILDLIQVLSADENINLKDISQQDVIK